MKRSIVAVLVASVSLTACGSSGATGAQASGSRDIGSLDLDLAPEVLGLNVQREGIRDALRTVSPSYVEKAALYSFRSSDDVVQATLQVSYFRDAPRYTTSQFRRTIINQIGATSPRQTRMDSRYVWRTSGSNLAMAVWFEGRFMYLLSIRDDFEFPRALIRKMLAIAPTT